MVAAATQRARRVLSQRRDRQSSIGAGRPKHHGSGDRASYDQSRVVELLQLEADARGVKTQTELEHLAANASLKFLQADRAYVFVASRTMRLAAVSGLPNVNRDAPFVQDIEALLVRAADRFGLDREQRFTWTEVAEQTRSSIKTGSDQSLLWVPCCTNGERPLGGLLLSRTVHWSDADEVLARRLADIFGHALALLRALKPKRLLSWVRGRRRTLAITLAALLAALAFPVPMTTLSPFEVVPRNAYITAAPIEGVIKTIHVEPGEYVEEGQKLVQFSDTSLRNRYEIAEREVLVANARLMKASQLAFDDISGRHELRLAMADQALKVAQRDFALEMLRRANVTAGASGIALFSDRQSLVGKPVTLGEKILSIANPEQVEVAIDVAIADAVALEKHAKVRLYFASNPLGTRDALVELIDYRARKREGDAPTQRVVARLSGQQVKGSILGKRGTAKIYGAQVPLAMFLFRRPLSAIRQWLGL